MESGLGTALQVRAGGDVPPADLGDFAVARYRPWCDWGTFDWPARAILCTRARDEIETAMVTRYAVTRAELAGRDKCRRVGWVRGLVWLALDQLNFTTVEIGAEYGRNHSTVSRLLKDLKGGCRKDRPGASAAEIREALRVLRDHLAMVPGPNPDDVREQAMASGPCHEQQLARYRATVRLMLDSPVDVAMRVWAAWCGAEYPDTWVGNYLVPPWEFRRLHPGVPEGTSGAGTVPATEDQPNHRKRDSIAGPVRRSTSSQAELHGGACP